MSTIQFSTVLPWCDRQCMSACVCMYCYTHLSTQLLHLQNDGSYDLQCPGVDSQPAWTHSQCRTHCLDIWVQHLVQMPCNSQQRHLKPKQNLLCVKLLSRALGCSILSAIRIVHLTLIATEPIKWSLFTGTHIPSEGSPSWVQTTAASAASQESSQTVPHWLLKQISTRPSLEFRPSLSLMSPSWQRARKFWKIQIKLCADYYKYRPDCSTWH